MPTINPSRGEKDGLGEMESDANDNNDADADADADAYASRLIVSWPRPDFQLALAVDILSLVHLSLRRLEMFGPTRPIS